MQYTQFLFLRNSCGKSYKKRMNYNEEKNFNLIYGFFQRLHCQISFKHSPVLFWDF